MLRQHIFPVSRNGTQRRGSLLYLVHVILRLFLHVSRITLKVLIRVFFQSEFCREHITGQKETACNKGKDKPDSRHPGAVRQIHTYRISCRTGNTKIPVIVDEVEPHIHVSESLRVHTETIGITSLQITPAAGKNLVGHRIDFHDHPLF